MNKNIKINKKMKSYVNIILTAVIITFILILSYVLYTKSLVDAWENRVYPGIKINNIDVSGKTKEEVSKIITDNFSKSIETQKLLAKFKDNSFELEYKSLNPQLNLDETIKEAIGYGKDGKLFSKGKLIRKGVNKNLEIIIKYDEQKINSFKDEIKSKINYDAKNASIKISNDNISIVPEEEGLMVKETEFDKELRKILNNIKNEKSELEIPVENVKPKITKEQLVKINGKLSTFSTSFGSSSADRAANLILATKFCNGKVVMPGETFSYNETVGERTYARGFRNAAVFINNKVVDDVGGGICQVSTTLYRAAMRANLRSVERHNHSMKTSYSDPGLDATVAWGALDYKFKNNYDFPIYIEGIAQNRYVTFNIYGNVEAMGNKTYELIAENVQRIEPSIKIVEDASVAEGSSSWDVSPVTGYRSTSYLVTYENGTAIKKELISKDVYNKVDGIKRVGTKKDAPEPAPTPIPIDPPKTEQQGNQGTNSTTNQQNGQTTSTNNSSNPSPAR